MCAQPFGPRLKAAMSNVVTVSVSFPFHELTGMPFRSLPLPLNAVMLNCRPIAAARANFHTNDLSGSKHCEVEEARVTQHFVAENSLASWYRRSRSDLRLCSLTWGLGLKHERSKDATVNFKKFGLTG